MNSMKFYDSIGEEHDTLIGSMIASGFNKLMKKTSSFRDKVSTAMYGPLDDIYVDTDDIDET